MVHRENSLLRMGMFLKESLRTIRWWHTTWIETKLPFFCGVNTYSTFKMLGRRQVLRYNDFKSALPVSVIHLCTRHGSKHRKSDGYNPWERAGHGAWTGQVLLQTVKYFFPHIPIFHPLPWCCASSITGELCGADAQYRAEVHLHVLQQTWQSPLPS